MKVRLGFVTNSSSSLFILGFKKMDRDAIVADITAQAPAPYVGIIVNDVLKEVLTINECIERYRRELTDYHGKRAKKTIDKEVEKLKKKIEKRGLNAFAFVWYGNSGGNESGVGMEIENFVIPEMDAYLDYISYH